MTVRILQAIACATVVTIAALPATAAKPSAPKETSKKTKSPKTHGKAGAPADSETAAANSSEVSKEETLLLEGLAQLRAWKIAEADETLGQVCPEFKEEAGEGTTLEDLACSARAVSFNEVQGAKDAFGRADGYWWAGDRARRTDKLQVARAFFELGLDRNPRDSDLKTGLGRVQRETGDLAQSTKTFREAIELDVANFDAVYWLAANRMDQNDPAEAEALLRKIVAQDKEFGHAWYRLGQLQMQKNDPLSALEMFEKAKAGGVDKKLVRERIAECRKAINPKAPH